MASFAVKFLGCKVSQADAMQARGALLAAGHTEVPEAEADLHVINTCCITSEAEAKSRQSVRRSLKSAQRVYVAGRLANTPDNLIRWIRDPRAVEPHTAMPAVGLDEAGARDIAAYLYTR